MIRPTLAISLVLGFSAFAWMSPAVHAQAPSAAVPPLKGKPSTSDTYLQGYLTMLEGDKLVKNRDFVGAYIKYREARDTFDAVHAGDPAWNAEIIDYRRRKIRESMEEVRQKEIDRRAAGGEPSPHGILGGAKADPKAPADVVDLMAEKDPGRPAQSPATLMEERMKALYLQISKLEKRNEEILKSLGSKEEELRQASRERLQSQASEKALKEKLIDTQTKLETSSAGEKRRHADLLKKVDELQNALNLANEQLKAANDSRAAMSTDLANAIAEIKRLNTEVTGLRKERDQMMNLLTGGDGPKAVEKLKIIEENQRLKKELAAAQEKITHLSAEKAADRVEISALKDQVKAVQESLAAVEQENEDYRQQIAALSKKLESASRMLADSGDTGAIPESEAVAENNVLREIILQQLKQQARRDRARQNIMDELAKEGVLDKMKELGVESESILRSINEMAAATPISREQRDILASSQVSKLLKNRDGTEMFHVDVADDSPEVPADGLDVPPPSTGAEDKASLSPELKAYANAAEQDFLAGDFASAENNFQKILVAERQNVYALCNLGVTQLRLGKTEEAADTLMRAQAYNFDLEFPHYARGVALLRLGRMDDAAEEIADALKLNDKNAAAWHTLGLIAIKNGQRDQARQHFLQAITVDPACAESHFNLAVYFATSNPAQLETARKHYRLAVNAGSSRDKGLDMLLGR